MTPTTDEDWMRLALADIPDGRYAFTDHLDDGSPIAVTSSDQVPSP